MAKSKHATALFEVMARQRAMESRTGSSNVTLVPPSKSGSGSAADPSSSSAPPRWWFKSRTAPDVKTIAPGEQVTVSVAPEGAAEASFFTRVSVDLRIEDTSRSYHVPLLLARYSLTTYRGS